MKNTILIILLILIIYSCNKKSNTNFSEHEWIYTYEYLNDDYKLESKSRVMFRNALAISYSELHSKEIAFPIKVQDSTLAFKILYSIKASNDSETLKDTTLTDTVLYDFKNIKGFPTLVLKSLKYDYHIILSCSDKDAIIEETNNFLKIPSFKISGYDIGDTINLNQLENIRDIEYGLKGGISGTLVENPDIQLEIIDKKYIYKIEQSGIENNALENIIKVVNSKLGIFPDTLIENPPFYEKGFRWDTDEIKITLSKRDMTKYYLDRAEEQDNSGSGKSMKDYYLRKAYNATKSKGYTLVYENAIIQKVLEYNQKNETISTIIE